MSYKKFEKNDIFFNVIKTKPRFEFKIYNGNTYINNSLGDLILNSLQVTPPELSELSCDNILDFSCQDNTQYLGLF